jgi:hypothetical protein
LKTEVSKEEIKVESSTVLKDETVYQKETERVENISEEDIPFFL